MLAEKDINGHSLLAMAVRSGSKEVVEQVLLILRRELSERKVLLFHSLPNINTREAIKKVIAYFAAYASKRYSPHF